MNMHGVDPLSLSSPLWVSLIIFLAHFTNPSNCAFESFVYVGCSQLKYTPGSPYESNVNSMLSSAVNSASLSNFNKYKFSLPGSGPSDVVYGLFQCRGDISISDCHHCVASAVSQLGAYCVDASGGALQLDGCFVKYDNTSFLGVQDTDVISHKCGPSIADDTVLLTGRDPVLSYLTAGDQFYRVARSGKVQGMAQCVQDLSTSACQDCLLEAIQRLKTQCWTSARGDMFLGKCYAQYSERGSTSKSGAILIGLITGVALLIVSLS